MSRSAMSKSIAPSATLLKFLRAQTEGYVFFTPNHVLKRKHSAASIWAKRPVSKKSTNLPPSSSRAIATCSPAVFPIEASLFPILESIRSRFSRSSSSNLPLEPFNHDQHPSYNSKNSVSPSETHSLHSLSRYQHHQHAHTRSLSTTSSSSSPQDPEVHNPQSYNRWARWARAWRSNKNPRPQQPLQPNDLPPLSSFLDDGASLGRIGKPINELRLRCTEFDENGNVTLVNGEFKKSELIARYGLLPRDLRKIDSALLPSIVIRPSAILINLLHLRVLIKHNRVLVFDAYGSTDSYTQSQFMYDLEGKLRSSDTRASTPSVGALPYEFRALEAVLLSVTTGLESEFDYVREPVVRVLRELEEDIDRDKLRHLLIYSKKLGTFEQKARLVRDAIDDLLEADDDLAAMYLSEKWGPQQTARGEDDHTEVEMLLESYHRVCDEIVQVSGNLVSNIRNTEEIVKAILDANRNSLMLLDLKFSIGTLGLAGGTFVAALYGMNLKNFIEESDMGFWGVSAWCTVCSVAVCWYGLKKLRRVQRVSMWGSSRSTEEGGSLLGLGNTRGIRGRSGWAQLGGLERPVSKGRPALFEHLKPDRKRYAQAYQTQAPTSSSPKQPTAPSTTTPSSYSPSTLPPIPQKTALPPFKPKNP